MLASKPSQYVTSYLTKAPTSTQPTIPLG